MNCPKCPSTLTEYEYQGVKLDFCRSCGGSWFDEGEVSTFFLLKKDLPDDAIPDTSFDSSGPKCPRDGSILMEYRYTHETDLLVDVCTVCKGIWFDQGEVRKLEQLAPQLDMRLVKIFEVFDFN